MQKPGGYRRFGDAIRPIDRDDDIISFQQKTGHTEFVLF
jgi:hypothetical protein